MARKPFDPNDTAAARRAREEAPLLASAAPEAQADTTTPPPAVPRLTVSQLADRIDGALKAGFPQRLAVVGEVSGFTDRTHWYFTLKDANAVVECVMFASAARKAAPNLLGGRLQQGTQVVAWGRLEFYAKGGKVSFIVDRLEGVGVGALDLAFRKLCDELKGLGWFDPARKRPLPAFPRRIAVVTSRTGAALQDVLNTVTRRCPAVGIVLADVRVQGEGAAAEVVAALRTIAAHHDRLGIDAVLVTRGGGSKEDLWTFNERPVAQAILESPIPVVAAIGHETDTSIAELVADERCATPTQAAMRLTPETPALLRQADSLARRLGSLLQSRVTHARQRLVSLARRPALADPGRLADQARHRLETAIRHLDSSMTILLERAARRAGSAAARLDRAQPAAVRARMAGRLDTLSARLTAAVRRHLAAQRPDPLADRLSRAVTRTLEAARDRVTAAGRQLELVGPARVLERGYSLTTTADGTLVRRPEQAPPGTSLVTRLAQGRLTSTVDGATASPPLQPPAPPVPPRKPARKARPPTQDPPDQLDRVRG
jgi:exodeoxyribonuclease VII large subunit